MLSALLLCSRYLAVRGADAARLVRWVRKGRRGRGGVRGAERPLGSRRGRLIPREIRAGNELPGPEVSFPSCSHGSLVAPKETGTFFLPCLTAH